MSVGEWIVSIILFIVSLGVLITIHELGHFSMAKLFNVYCQEFSIGFGPAIIHKRKEGKETYFSIRAIPLGGYVSMYGEEMELEPGVVIGEERSLEGIKKWKKAIILSAGVIMNAVLALLLFSISNLAFPLIKATTIASVSESSIAYNAGIRSDDTIQFYSAPDSEVISFIYDYTVDGVIHQGALCIVDPNVTIGEKHYVLTYYPEGTKSESNFSRASKLYVGLTQEEVIADKDILNTFAGYFNIDGESVTPKEGALTYYPNFKIDPLQAYDSSLTYEAVIPYKTGDGEVKNANVTMAVEPIKEGSDQLQWKDIGLNFQLRQEWLPFGTRVVNTFKDFGTAASAVFQGLGILFTGGIKNMSGFVGIMKMSAEIYGSYAFSTYLYFWGLISVNLAIFNLLPFPGLDGFALLVTAIEGATRKKVPNKFKNIMSIIGLALLFILMAVIVTFDILRWTGVM